MWTRIKSRLMGQKQAPEVADETEDSWRQHINRSRKDSPMTASGSSCNTPPGKTKPRSKSKTRFFSFGRASIKKKNSFDETLLTINQTHLDAADNTCEQEIEKFLQDVVDFKPVDEQHGPEVAEIKKIGSDVADSALAPDNETKFEAVFCGRKSNAERLKRSEANVVESPVWIHRIWDGDGDDDDDDEDERIASIAAASDLNDGATGPLMAAGDKALLVRECSGGVTGVSPPRMKRRKKPAPPIRVESRKSRLASNQTSPTNHVVPTSGCEPPGIPPDMFSVDLDKRLDSVDSLLTDSLSINLSPSPVVGVRSFPEVTSGFSEVTSGFELKEMTDKDFLFNCPEYATCDELDGKESGYVTLEEFHAKFMNDIDGNFMNDIVSQTNIVSQTDNLGRSDNVSRSHTVDTENKQSLELRYPTLPFAISNPAKSVAIFDPGSAVDVPGATKDQARVTEDIEKPSTSASDPSSVLRLTFTVKLESRMFQRRQGQKLKQLRSSEATDDLSDQQTHAVSKPSLCSNCFESRVGVEDNGSASRGDNTHLARSGKLSPPPMPTDNQSQLKLGDDHSSTLAVLQSSLEISVDGSSGKIESLPLPIGSDVVDSDSKDDRNVLTQTFQVQLPPSGGDESRACIQYREHCSSPADSSQGTSATLKSNCHASSPTDIASNILANNDRNKSLELEREYDFGEDEILEITEDDDGSYLHPLTTRNYENRPSDGIQQLASSKILLPQTCKTASDLEQTHMNWGEVLEEAEILGIPLHPPNVALSCSESDKRSSKSSSISSVTREFGQSSPVINGQVTSTRKHGRGGQSGEQPGTNAGVAGKKIEKVGRDKEQSRSKSSSSVLRDMFKLQNIFSRSNKENRNKPRSSESDSPVTSQRRYRTSRSPGTRSNIQSRTLPPVPADGELHDSCCSAPFDRTYNASRSSFGSGTSRPESSSPCPRSPLSPTCRVQGSFPRTSARSVSTSRDYFPDDFGRSICSSGSIPLSYRGVGMCFSPSTSSFGSVFSSCSPCTGSRLVPPASAPIDTVDARRLFMPGRSRSNQNDIAQSFGQLQNAAWYWGSIGFEVAEAKLANRPDGTFLVRDSTDDRYILSLSFRSAGTTHHTRIEHYKGIFSFYSQPKPPGGATTIVEFIETAMAASKSGQCLYYLQPRGPGQPPAPVRLVYPLSRFRCMHSLQHLWIFSFYSQPKPPGGATTIVEFIETAMAASKSGQCLYYLQPRGPGQPPAPVRLVYPLSRFRCMHSLQHLCKFAVLRHVRLDMIDRLPIPPRLKEYLKHSQCQGRPQLQNKE